MSLSWAWVIVVLAPVYTLGAIFAAGWYLNLPMWARLAVWLPVVVAMVMTFV